MKSLFTFALVPLATAITSAAERPNVVFILCDDLRWDCLGIAGHPHLKTPNIDRIAKEGVYFKNAFCTTSLCSPSRASILSGKYAHAHEVVNNFTEYPVDLPSFPRQLQTAGYETAYIGKWHMGEENDSPRPGFDHFVTHKGAREVFRHRVCHQWRAESHSRLLHARRHRPGRGLAEAEARQAVPADAGPQSAA